MFVSPAVDLRDGACVQPANGSNGEQRIRLADPTAVVQSWSHLGFRHLHVVDLNAALGNGSNLPLVEEILRDAHADVHVGGGIRSTDAIEQLFRAGADGIVVGTRAIEDPEWLADVAGMYPGVIVVATDVRDRRVVTRGWVRTLPVDVLDVIEALNALPLGGVLVTAVQLDGQVRGTDLALMEDVAEKANFPVIASGGVGSMSDLRALEHRGIAGVLLGVALYSGMLDARAVAQEFGE